MVRRAGANRRWRYMSWAVESPWNSDSNGNDEGADKDIGKGGDEGARDGGEGGASGGEGEDTRSCCSINQLPTSIL